MTRIVILVITLMTSWQTAQAYEYQDNPFNDKEFKHPAILMNKANITSTRLEVGGLFTTSIVDKYTTHLGGALTVDYHISDQWAVEVYGGYFQSGYTPIVTSDGGIRGYISYSHQQRDYYLPDREMMTFIADVVAIFTPIYGKINLVSELSFNTSLYFLLGAGVNGTRTISYFGDTEDLGIKPNITFGGGIKFYLTKWMTMRIEYRDIDFINHFVDPRPGINEEYNYVAMKHMLHVGFSFFPF